MNTHLTLALVVALSGCATAPPQQAQPQTTTQSSSCHSQLVSQHLFMVIAGRGLQACIDRPAYDTCMVATSTVERMQVNLGLDHALFRSCFPEYLRTEREAFKETAVELSVFQKKLARVSDLFNKASKAGHF